MKRIFLFIFTMLAAVGEVKSSTVVNPFHVEDRINKIQILATDRLVMQESGFLEVFANNDANTPVYYDNMTVTHTPGRVLEINTYYPYGMIIPELSAKAALKDEQNWYKYSGKELQKELNLNVYDFGNRIQDPVVGRFWTPDRFAEKYYHLSPYSYAGNNPINYIDINGDSIWYTQLDNVITMHVRGKVINSSSDDINVQRAAHDISFGITSTFGGNFEMGGQEYMLKSDVQLDAVTSMDGVAASDHLFNIVDADGKSARGAVNEIGGKVINLASDDYANDNWLSNAVSVNTVRSAVHEFGHAVGLKHESASGWSNIMRQKHGDFLSPKQMGTMMRRSSSINRGTNSFMGRPYPYLHDPITGQIYRAYDLFHWNTRYKR